MVPGRLSASLLSAALLLGACAPTPKPVAAPSPERVVVAPTPPDAQPAAAPAAAPAKAEKVRELEGITEYRLPNGMQILLYPDASKSTVTVNMTYLVGSRVEGYGETGMAHLLEHMTFKGTAKYDNIMSVLSARGASFNGTTWFDRTNYYETLPASPDNVAFALDLEAERMRKSKMLASDLATEFSVVRSEFEIGENDPRGVLDERVWSTAYLWHNYGKSTIGSRSDIERVPIANLKAFYDKYYQPDNAILIVGGKFDPSETLALIERTYGAIPKPDRTLGESYTVEPVQDGARAVTLARNGDVHVLEVAYHTVAGSDPQYPAMEAVADLLTRDPSGRLFKALVKTKLAASVSGNVGLFRDPTLFTIAAEIPDGKNVEKVRQQLLTTIEGLGATKITAEEVERWRNDALKNVELALADTRRSAVALSDWAALGDWRLMFAYRDRLRTLTVDDVQAAAKTWLKESNRTLGEFVPTKAADRSPLAERPDVAAIANAVKGEQVQEGEAFVASIDNLEARTKLQQLDGGISAAFLEKKTRGATVTLRLTLRFGDLKSLRGKGLAPMALAELAQRGTKHHTYQQLQDEESRLRARISLVGGPSQLDVRIETVRESLPAALDLALEMLTEPTLPVDELEVIRNESIAGATQNLTDPETLAYEAFGAVLSPFPKDDPRYEMTSQEQIAAWKKLKVADVKAFHRDFWGSGKGELAVVGDFDRDALSAQIEQKLGRWKTRAPFTRLPDQHFDVAAATQKIDLKDKENAVIVVGGNLQLQDNAPDYPAAMIAGYIAGGSSTSRLWTRLRQKEGWSYGTGAWLSASAFDAVGSFTGSASVAPANLASLRAAMLEEIARLAKDGVTQAELDAAKAAWTQGDDTTLANDRYVTNLLGNLLYTGRTLAYRRELRAKVAALTVADVNAAAAKYIVPSSFTIIEAADFAKAKAAAAK